MENLDPEEIKKFNEMASTWWDPNGDFKRAMGVGSVPHTFLLNENKEIVYQHTGYKDGDEYDLFKKIEALSK